MKTLAIHPSHSRTSQRGAATMVVVMVLLFVVSMVAAYTSRNLIFEQRTGVNQYRSTQALEAAQAGLEWAKSLINQGRIDADCQPSTNVADSTFRERYLNVDSNGSILPKFIGGTAVITNNLTPTCVYNGTDWDCSCPSSAAPATLTGTGPAFRVRIGYPYSSYMTQPSSVRLEVVGCTANNDTCLSFVGQGQTGEGRAVVTELLSLAAGLPSPPAAALTAGGAVGPSGTLTAINGGSTAGGIVAAGITVHAAGAVNATNLTLVSAPGADPSASVIAGDTTLQGNTADLFFAGFFNTWPAMYRQATGTVVLTTGTSGCTSTGCNAAAVRTALTLNPGQPLWVEGDLTVDSAGDIGSTSAPALLVVNGNLNFSTPATVYGFVYLRTPSWTTFGTGTVRGGLVAEGAVTGGGTPTLVFDNDVLRNLRLKHGTFVLVPGGWKDYCSTLQGVQDPANNLGC